MFIRLMVLFCLCFSIVAHADTKRKDCYANCSLDRKFQYIVEQLTVFTPAPNVSIVLGGNTPAPKLHISHDRFDAPDDEITWHLVQVRWIY